MERSPDTYAWSELLAHRPFVQAQLRRFGVAAGSVDDLTQEVWLLAVSQRQAFRDERAARAWLTAVCRRLAANHRRSRTRVNATADETKLSDTVQEDQLDALEGADLRTLSDMALARLKDEQRDVLSLYGGGDLSMREVAELVGEREPTVYARYRTAIAQLARDLARNDLPRSEEVRPHARRTPPFPSAQGTELEADQGNLIFYRCDSEMVLGRLGNVVIARWQQRAFEQSSESLGTTLSRVHERLGAPLVLINDAAPNLVMPNASERRTMLSQMWSTRGATSVIVDIFADHAGLKVLTAVLTGLMSITRSLPRSSFRVVMDIDSARPWLEPHARSLQAPLPWLAVRDAIMSARCMG
ncbi:MAG: sigma-70 family RNA polymerase sigma factor [Myxococcales bacterium]